MLSGNSRTVSGNSLAEGRKSSTSNQPKPTTQPLSHPPRPRPPPQHLRSLLSRLPPLLLLLQRTKFRPRQRPCLPVDLPPHRPLLTFRSENQDADPFPLYSPGPSIGPLRTFSRPGKPKACASGDRLDSGTGTGTGTGTRTSFPHPCYRGASATHHGRSKPSTYTNVNEKHGRWG